MNGKMTAAVLYGKEDVKIERVPIPHVEDGEVLVKVQVALTCGTDLKVYQRGYHARMIVPPALFGHELAGVIEETGPGVRGFKKGMRVVALNSAPCQMCFYCSRHQENLCEDLLFNNGAYAEYIRIPRRIVDLNTLALPPHVSFEEAAHGGTRRVYLPDGKEVDVRIPVGVRDGQQIRLRGQGGEGRNGGPPGDVLLNVSVAPHPYLTRDANNLRMDLPIALQEAVLGGKVNVPTLTGLVSLSVPANSNSGSVLRLKGKGIPAHGKEPAGDLYVKLVVTLPDSADPELRKFAESWAAQYDPRAKLR